MRNWKSNRLDSAMNGTNPTVLTEMKSGFAVIADNQFLPGYCILISKIKNKNLNELSIEERTNYLIDTTIIGDAIIKVCNPLRINYSTLTNLDEFLHTHIKPRYKWEPEEYLKGSTYLYPKEKRLNKNTKFNEKKYGELKKELSKKIKTLMREYY